MSDNWSIQVSPRVGDTLINLRAETGEQMLSILSWYEQNSATIASALGTGAAGGAVGAAFPGPGTQNVQQDQGSWSQQGSQQAPPAFAQPAPAAGPPAPMCPHGQMVYRESKPGAAKSWKAYMCPAPKGTPGACEPQWQR